MQIASVVGARPQFIKLGMMDLAIRRLAAETDVPIDHRILHTGQHYDANLSHVFFEQLDLPQPDTNLGIGSGKHGEQTGKMLAGLDACLSKDRPDLVLTYGDTNSTLAAALAAVKRHIAVGHVESGLRSRRKDMPEEVNRVLTDHASTFLFCPTVQAVHNLEHEGFKDPVCEGRIISCGFEAHPAKASADAPWVVNVGDVMYDSVLHHIDRAASGGISEPALRSLPSSHVVLTVHRAENTNDAERLRGILTAAERLASGGTAVVFPIHPRTRSAIARASLEPLLSELTVVDPISYYDMLLLVRDAQLVLTDSGGLQREAFMLGRPCVTLREETEWVELLETGLSVLGGTEPETILGAVKRVARNEGGSSESPYGDGHAADRIARVVMAWWKRVDA